MSGPREERAQGRGQGRSQADDRAAGAAPTGGPQPADPAPADWYVADTYAQDPYAADPYGSSADQDPYGLRAAGPAVPPQPNGHPEEQPSEHPEPSLTAPAPRWAGMGTGSDAPEAPGTERVREGSPWNTETTEYVGVDALLSTRKPDEPSEKPPFVPPIEFDPPLSEEEANLQVAAVQVPPAVSVPDEPAPAEPGTNGGGGAGKVAGLLNSSAIMAAGTLVSRGTGFLRTMVIAAAIGVGTMGDSYNAANTLPTLLYILIGGGALNAVFVPQLVRSMKHDEDGGTAYANRLLTLVMTGLAGVAAVAVVAAPLLVQLISHSLMRNPESADTTVALARYCLPTIFFMGVHVVMGQILNARGRFGAMMWTPVLNNIVVIFTFGMYIWVFGTFEHSEVTPETVSPEGIRLLGIGTLLGLSVQALAMIPYLRASGFHFKPRFDWRGHGLGKAARLAKWTFLFVLANQAGYLVVTQLATAAGAAAESTGHLGVGLAAYSNALLIWQLPMAVITVSVMSAVLPRLSRSAADADAGAVRDDLSYGLRTSAVAIVPSAFLFLALGPVIGSAIYGLGNGGAVAHGTTAVGFMLSAFALGLIPYSVQYVLLRGFYAYEDTRTPFSNTVWVAVCQAGTAVICYLVLPAQWAVTGMALGYGASYAVGVAVAVPKLKAKIGGLDTKRIAKTYVRLAIASVPAAAVGIGAALLVNGQVEGWSGSVITLLVAGGLQLAVFVVIARRMRIEELNAMIGMVRSRLGR
ncbi:murein biosynthesis integral membrane protein MurJ [Kitasatospora atroaurantiaca]|uniref:Putative peptidoglycan lipid II flippase n=1 Tax=Kitasatospora atroaurantiaca TaxID=285545 RepID=A0A561ESK6_9ACTN|nr:murein biosynthesis integral membrane protein MurJ [Kitasatospora atroaurantiaca]TWE18584.1 putative peptidoglycan lipid II flippase [Kitasatospora atroaurantiaca]